MQVAYLLHTGIRQPNGSFSQVEETIINRPFQAVTAQKAALAKGNTVLYFEPVGEDVDYVVVLETLEELKKLMRLSGRLYECTPSALAKSG